MRICFDLDGVICEGESYDSMHPIPGTIETINNLSKEGNTIIIYTARGMGRTNGNLGKATKLLGELTLAQLKEWGVYYDEMYFGKPSAEIYIDDKALSSINELVLRLERSKD